MKISPMTGRVPLSVTLAPPALEERSHGIGWGARQGKVSNDKVGSSKKPLTEKIGIRYMVYLMLSSLLRLKSFAKPILRDEVYLSIKEKIFAETENGTLQL
jgi:hypothetical protein